MEIFVKLLKNTFSEISLRDIIIEISFQICLIGIRGTFLADIAKVVFYKENIREISKR